ncbi:MAG: murein biosynthesis integral membrane protein MurJ, partial [Hyphomicrobium sp.]
AIVGIAIGVVLLPDVSRHLRAGNTAAVMDSQNRSFEFAMLLTLPAAIALFVIPREIVGILFERGVFTAKDTIYTAEALRLFAVGLPAFVLIKVFSPAYFARHDTKTPMTYAGWSLTANTIGSVVLFFLFRSLGWFPHLGIAVATTLGGWMNALLLYKGLTDKNHFIVDQRLKKALPRIFFSAVLMGIFLYFSAFLMKEIMSGISVTYLNFFALVVLVATGMLFYFLVILLTGAASLQQLRSIVRRI